MKHFVPMCAEPNPVEELHWYALRAFRSSTATLIEEAEKAGMRTYYATHTVKHDMDGRQVVKEEPLVPSLFFVRCPEKWLQEFKYRHVSRMRVYTDVPGGKPAPIRDKEMDVFIMVTSAHDSGNSIEYIGEPKPQFVQGDVVRVTQGIYKGVQGVVKRIRKDRKLIVAITGVAMVAISHIPMDILEKVEE